MFTENPNKEIHCLMISGQGLYNQDLNNANNLKCFGKGGAKQDDYGQMQSPLLQLEKTQLHRQGGTCLMAVCFDGVF